MTQKPHRPFVPHRTPKATRTVTTASEFRLYAPFVPGSERMMVEQVSPTDAAALVEAQSGMSAPLRPIQDFLDASPTPGYQQDTNDESFVSELEDEPEELPPVEHFVDPLPMVDFFAPDNEGGLPGNGAVATDERPRDPSEAGWLETDWQHYDWRAAAALGESPNDEASSAWATTDWDGVRAGARDPRPTAAQAIATALDEIARRIRDGELAVPGQGSMADPATIAATLAAILGVKR